MNHLIHEVALKHLIHLLFRHARMFRAGACITSVAQLFVLLVLAGCTLPMPGDHQMAANEKPPRPSRILVRDFAVAPADVPSDAPVGARISAGVSLSPEQIAIDRQLGSNMTAQLVTAIREMGLPAERALPGAKPEIADLVIHGYLVSMHEGSGAKRLSIGVHFDAAELRTVVEGFQVTEQGLGSQLYFNTATAGPNETPGIAVGQTAVPVSGNTAGFIVTSGMKIDGEASSRARMDGWSRQTTKEIADRLKMKFQEQGWIN